MRRSREYAPPPWNDCMAFVLPLWSQVELGGGSQDETCLSSLCSWNVMERSLTTGLVMLAGLGGIEAGTRSGTHAWRAVLWYASFAGYHFRYQIVRKLPVISREVLHSTKVDWSINGNKREWELSTNRPLDNPCQPKIYTLLQGIT